MKVTATQDDLRYQPLYTPVEVRANRTGQGRDSRAFYPFTYEQAPKIVVMDPTVAYGRPVVAGTRIRSGMIDDRYSGGESLSDIAGDDDRDVSPVEEALRCETARNAA